MADSRLKKHILTSAILLIAIMVVLTLYTGYIAVWKADELVASPLNMRRSVTQNGIWRGSILDANGDILATTNEAGTRVYPYGAELSAVTGYNGENIGSAGIEGHANTELLGLTDDLSRLGPIAQLFQADRGNDVQLTIDTRAQEAAYKGLLGHNGAVVVLDAATGAVIAMASAPAYDPNAIEANWETLSKENAGPLLNRAVQGMYPPGSTIKPMIADIALTEGVTNEQEMFHCDGSLDVGGGHSISESHGEIHHDLNLRTALTESCNVTFGTLGIRLGDEKLKQGFERFGFANDLGDAILMAKSHFPDFGHLGMGDKAQTAIGQSALLVTPMHMALMASAFANGGVVMKPYLISKVIAPNGMVLESSNPQKWFTATTPTMAAKIDSYMEDVVVKGTGTAAKMDGIRVTGKTGTAENAHGEDHAWFIGSAEIKNRRIAFAIIVENGGSGGKVAAPIARQIIMSLL